MSELTIEVNGAAAVVKRYGELGQKITDLVVDRILTRLEQAQKFMQEPGKRITYPVQWDSDKQRKYVMALLRESGNLPYQRTGAYVGAWTLLAQRKPVRVELSNASPSAEYMCGKRQSRIHQGRWNVLADEYNRVARELPTQVRQDIAALVGAPA